MLRLEVKKRAIPKDELLRRTALESDCSQLISQPAVLMDGGKPVIIYDHFAGDLAPVIWAVKNTKYQTGTRISGITNTSRIFGFRPRNELRSDFCSSASYAMEQPKQHGLICAYGEKLARIYQEKFPEEYGEQQKIVEEKIRPEWVIPNTPFTSGIINKNNSLKYHYDRGNFNHVRSCMLVLRSQTEGGQLCIPEYDVRLDLSHGAILIFDGQSILHGVSKINRLSPLAYRYSIVYYSLKRMCECLPPEEELRRIRQVRMQREIKKL